MKFWFVAFAYQVTENSPIKFGNSVITTAGDHFVFTHITQQLMEKNKFVSVSIVNWKEMNYIQYKMAMDHQAEHQMRDVSN